MSDSAGGSNPEKHKPRKLEDIEVGQRVRLASLPSGPRIGTVVRKSEIDDMLHVRLLGIGVELFVKLSDIEYAWEVHGKKTLLEITQELYLCALEEAAGGYRIGNRTEEDVVHAYRWARDLAKARAQLPPPKPHEFIRLCGCGKCWFCTGIIEIKEQSK